VKRPFSSNSATVRRVVGQRAEARLAEPRAVARLVRVAHGDRDQRRGPEVDRALHEPDPQGNPDVTHSGRSGEAQAGVVHDRTCERRDERYDVRSARAEQQAGGRDRENEARERRRLGVATHDQPDGETEPHARDQNVRAEPYARAVHQTHGRRHDGQESTRHEDPRDGPRQRERDHEHADQVDQHQRQPDVVHARGGALLVLVGQVRRGEQTAHAREDLHGERVPVRHDPV
jgi:hypothetical protein